MCCWKEEVAEKRNDPWGDTVNLTLPAGVGRPGLLVPVHFIAAKKHSLMAEATA